MAKSDCLPPPADIQKLEMPIVSTSKVVKTQEITHICLLKPDISYTLAFFARQAGSELFPFFVFTLKMNFSYKGRRKMGPRPMHQGNPDLFSDMLSFDLRQTRSELLSFVCNKLKTQGSESLSPRCLKIEYDIEQTFITKGYL